MSAINNYRKHKEVTKFLGLTGTVELLVSLDRSKMVGIIRLENGQKKTVAIHADSFSAIKIGSKIRLSLRLESENPDGLKNYGLVANLLNL